MWALIIDVTAAIFMLFVWISLLGYCSHPVLSLFFLQGFIFMSQSTSVLRRNGFTFKQFFVAHDRCAMKVGTDAYCWVHGHGGGVKRCLDIGAGSGLLALMLAQRTDDSVMIDALSWKVKLPRRRRKISTSPVGRAD
ncbi:enzyme [Shigella dysenteriae]|uniref:Enzyme n=1 Tax=Shigella dysenteriae TaxID=622 RepID=A0A2X2K3N2_SHIDY|nr:enzyme [Shigella dysenteriae]